LVGVVCVLSVTLAMRLITAVHLGVEVSDLSPLPTHGADRRVCPRAPARTGLMTGKTEPGLTDGTHARLAEINPGKASVRA
jgi:hypothetical protein